MKCMPAMMHAAPSFDPYDMVATCRNNVQAWAQAEALKKGRIRSVIEQQGKFR